MKLTWRLTWALIAGLCLLLAAEGLWRIHNIEKWLLLDMHKDHLLIGRSAGRAIAEAPQVRNWQDALASLEKTFGATDSLRIRYSEIQPEGAQGLHDGRFYSYVPLPSDSPLGGFLEISEPLDEAQAFMRAATFRVVGFAVVMALMAAALSALLG